MSSDRRVHFGAYLARLRRDAGRSQRQLAERLCVLSGVCSVTRHEVSRWERGERIPDTWLPLLAQALGVPYRELERSAACARGEQSGPGPEPTAVLTELLPSADLLAPSSATSGRRIGMATVEQLAARVHGLRLADDVVAGGDLIVPASRELNAAVRLYRECTHTEATGTALLRQIGELAQIAGWIASDAGHRERAESAYAVGISAAQQAGDRTLTGNLAGSLAYHLSNTGRQAEGLRLASAAVQEAGENAHPKARALFLDRLAWAHTQAGEPQSAMQALGRAHEALSQRSPDEAPLWAYWVGRDELEVMDARVYTELRRPLRAVPLLTEVLGRYDATHAREVALYRSWLAVALADANEPEQAADEARPMLSVAEELASERAAGRARLVLHRLQHFLDVPEVRSLFDVFAHFAASQGPMTS